MKAELTPLTPADELRSINMRWIWIGTFLVVVFILRVLDPVQAVEFLLMNQGIGDAGARAIAFVAGFTLPLSVGFFVIWFIVLRGLHRGHSGITQAIGAAAILFVSGLFAKELGLGLLPVYPGRVVSGPPWITIPLYVLTGYLTSYGIELFICALAIGAAAALQVERWLKKMM
jgi:hypothetical protein